MGGAIDRVAPRATIILNADAFDERHLTKAGYVADPRYDGSLDAFMRAFLAAPKKTSDLVLAMNIVAMAAAYSPNPDRPWRVDLPFDSTGEIIESVWARWLEGDPVRLVERHANALKGLRLLFLDCGKRDQFHLQYGLRIFRQRLSRLEIPHHAEEFDDDHSDVDYRMDVSLPFLYRAPKP